MEAVKTNKVNEVTIEIEELEAKVAPDAGSSASFLD
jgi:hypothetical protein